MGVFAIVLFLIFLIGLYYSIKVTIDGLSKPFDATHYHEYIQKNVKPIKINLPTTKVIKNKYHCLKGGRYKKN